jgi:transketolase
VRARLPFRAYGESVGWSYYLAKTDSGKILVIARKNGPVIQQLTSDDEWVDGSYWLTRFQDPDFFEEATEAEVQTAAESIGITVPGVTTAAEKKKHQAVLDALAKSPRALPVVAVAQQAWLLPKGSLERVKKALGRD